MKPRHGRLSRLAVGSRDCDGDGEGDGEGDGDGDADADADGDGDRDDDGDADTGADVKGDCDCDCVCRGGTSGSFAGCLTTSSVNVDLFEEDKIKMIRWL